VAGIKEKENGESIEVRRNYIHDCGVGIEVMNQNTLTTRAYRIYENVFHNCATAVGGNTNSTAVMKDIYIYNNVFSEYRAKAVNGTNHGSGRHIWNNIFYRSGSVSQADFFTYMDPPEEIVLMDYNLYTQQPRMRIGIYSTRRDFTGLRSWQRSGYGFDRNSVVVADPGFVDAAAGDFRLRPESPARGAGRSDGTPSGKRVNIGAYPADDERRIGLSWQTERAALTAAAQTR
jgi:hypothetical protein